MARDFTEQAAALFSRFAEKHRLVYEVVEAPVEILWKFPVQPKLRHSILLGLQNNDELNFGVGDFWSYFFPFEKKQAEFEAILNKWVEGDARIVAKSGVLFQRVELQVFEDGVWNTAYDATSLTWRKPAPFILTNAISW